MRGVVVRDQVQGRFRRRFGFDLPEKSQLFHMGETGFGAGNDPAIQSVQSGKQRRGAVPHIVMGAGADVTQPQGQTGLGALQGLTLAFLSTAQHQRPLGRVQIRPDDISELRLKLRMLGKLEGAHPVRFPIVDLPELLHPARCSRMNRRRQTPTV